MSDLLRRFTIEVIPRLPKHLGGPGGVQDIKQGPAAVVAPAQADEQQAEAAAFKAQVMNRLKALVDPFKQAIADDGPDVPQLHKLFGTIKTHVGKQQFFDASKALDTIEQLLNKQSSQTPDKDQDVADLEKLVATPSGEQTAAQEPEKVAAIGDPNVKEGISPSDIPGLHLPNPIILNCKITNNTEKPLILDPQSAKEVDTDGQLGLRHGQYKSPPQPQIAKGPGGTSDFTAITKKAAVPILGPFIDLNLEGVQGKVKYFIGEDKKNFWVIFFNHPRSKNTADAKVFGPDSAQFDSLVTFGQGEETTDQFTLIAKGGATPPPEPKPEPEPKPTPKPTAAVKASCLITVTNKSKAVLTLKHQNPEHGEFVTNPAATLNPGDATKFSYVQTPNENDPAKLGCKGSVTWQVGTPLAAIWRVEWDNHVGEKNTAGANLDPASAGFESLEQIGQGDENIPVDFTISGGGAGPGPVPPGPVPPGPVPPGPVPPGPVPPGPVPPVPPPEPFVPPVKEKQPTLRLGDKSRDGWVEYLQERLNKLLKTSPNLKEDGVYGKATQKAVFDYQEQEHLQHDGTVGNQTWASLRGGPKEAVGTDGRKPHTFVDKGVKARWFSERPAIYTTSSDKLELKAVSVGTDTNIEGVKVTVFITPPGGKRTQPPAKVGPVFQKTDTGEGNTHMVLFENFRKTFPSIPPGQPIEAYVIEGFFDQAQGGDSFSSTGGGQIFVVN